MKSPWDLDVSKAKTPLAFIFLVSKPYVRHAIFATLFVTVASVAGSIEPLVYKNIVDSIGKLAAGGTYTSVALWVGVYLLLMAVGMLLWRLGNHVAAYWVMGTRASGRYALTAYLLKHSHNYFENRFAGSTANKISHAADGAKNLVQEFVFGISGLLVNVVVSSILAFTTSVYVGAIFILWLLVGIPLNYRFSKNRSELTLRAQEAETTLRGAAVDLVTNIRAVQEYARAPYELSLVKQLVTRRYDFGLRNWMYGQYVSIVNSVIQIAFVGLMIGVAVYEAYLGHTTAGSIVLVVALATSVGERLFWISNQISNISEHWGEVKEGLSDLLNEHEILDIEGAKKLQLTSGNINFVATTFAYHEGESVIQDFSLKISGGQKIGLVGRSGAGKTTLVKLILRHYNLTSGTIEIDGQNIAEITQDSLRDSISVVPQEPLLFHRSIAENIGYGKEKATYDEIRTAAELAQAHDFIKTLPDGYDTLVGERGVKLSGGQRQRVAIARALLKSSKILILDEATSSLDSESEGDIQKGLESLMVGKTVIAIAHRLSTLRAMDRILVLESGKVVEDGTHDKLIKKRGGVYAEMWKHQSGGYLKE